MAKIKKNERPTISRSLDRLFSVLSVPVPVFGPTFLGLFALSLGLGLGTATETKDREIYRSR